MKKEIEKATEILQAHGWLLGFMAAFNNTALPERADGLRKGMARRVKPLPVILDRKGYETSV
ncbi:MULTISPECIES: hypothetical protein [Mesorhizobium]|uniref:hypothetical protein n=1 Tax=Mesorhizobium TaxID=68287 RepID=UPI001314C915|nr:MULTISPECIES: hypothetical protein [Mesorhizobium]